MYYVYILRNELDRKYIGVTADLPQRVTQHNRGGTKTTKNRGVYTPIWYCAFHNKSRAYAFEKYLKTSSGHAFMNKRLL